MFWPISNLKRSWSIYLCNYMYVHYICHISFLMLFDRTIHVEKLIIFLKHPPRWRSLRDLKTLRTCTGSIYSGISDSCKSLLKHHGKHVAPSPDSSDSVTTRILRYIFLPPNLLLILGSKSRIGILVVLAQHTIFVVICDVSYIM